MGFFKFLKKEKGTSQLDAPPAPPHIEESKEELELVKPEFPSMEEMPAPPKSHKLPKFGKALKHEEMKPPVMEEIEEKEMPAAPILPVSSPEEMQKPMAPPFPETTAPMPEVTMPELTPLEEMEQKISAKDIAQIPHKPIFVRADDYRMLLDEIMVSKNLLKQSDEIITRLEDIRSMKDKEFQHWKANLEDIERKLLWIDKALFIKGD